jgi:hypothetical protein
MMGQQSGDQSRLFYLFNLERRIPDPSIPRSCSAHRLRIRARVWAAKMVAAESWRFPPLSLQCALEFTRAFSGAIVQQANSR